MGVLPTHELSLVFRVGECNSLLKDIKNGPVRKGTKTFWLGWCVRRDNTNGKIKFYCSTLFPV